MNKLLKKVLSLTLAFAVILTCVPFSVFASTCTTHTPNVDDNGMVIYYVTETEHYNICTVCCEKYDVTVHTNDGSGVCADCGVTLNSGTATHSHTLTVNTYGHKDEFGHMVVCSDNNCLGEFETHTNCVVGDTNGDGTWDCDYCGWDGTIIGVGGGSHSHVHNGEYLAVGGKHYEVCGECNAAYGDAEDHEYDSFIENGAGHSKYCWMCGYTDTEVIPHTPDPDSVQVYEDGHANSCADCWAIMPETKAAHKDEDGDSLCDSCYLTIDENGNHIHNFGGWNIDETEHYKECIDCWFVDEAGLHTDDSGDGRCDVCNATVDSDNVHYHEEKYEYANSTGHYIICAGCGNQFGSEDHSDNNDDGICDECNTEIVKLDMAMTAESLEAVETALKDAIDKAINGDYTALEDITSLSDDSITELVEDWKADVADGETPQIFFDLYTQIAIKEDIADDPDLEEVFDNAEKSVNNSTANILFVYEVDAEISTSSSSIYFGLKNIGDVNYTVTINADDVKSNRTWYISESSDDNTFTKIAQTAKGASSITFSSDDFDSTYVLLYTEESSSNSHDNFAHVDENNDNYCDDCGAAKTEDWCDEHWHAGDYYEYGGKHYEVCGECNAAYGDAEDHEYDSFIENGAGHSKYCWMCGYTDTEVIPHTPDPDSVQVYEDGHANSCADCWAIMPETKAAHKDEDGDSLCDSCYLTIDENGNHIHNFGGWNIDETEHYKECIDCWFVDEAGLHTDDSGDGRCDVCNATVDSDNVHYHEEKYEYANSTGHYIICAGCGNQFGSEDHSDNNDDGICDECNTEIVKLDMAMTAESLEAVETALKDAIDKAINGDYTALEDITSLSDDSITELVEDWKADVADGETPQIFFDLYTQIAIKEDIADDPDLEEVFDNAEKSVNNSTANILFVYEVDAEISTSSSSIYFGLKNIGDVNYTVTINADDVKSNRTWYISESSDDNTFTKIAQTAKGASSITFSSDDFDSMYVLLYTEKSSSTGGSTSGSSVPSTSTTVTATPTVTPSVSTNEKTEDTSVSTEESVEMPKEADTTITDVVASEEVVEAVKENVTVSEGTATVDKSAVQAVVEATADEEPVVLPLVQATDNVVNKAEIDTEAFAAIADAEKEVVIEFTDATVKLDAKAVQAIAQQADGETIEIRVVKAEISSLTSEQQKKLKEMDTAIVVSVQVFSDGEYIGKFKGGKATVMLPFEIEEGRGAKDYKVYYIDEKGELKKVAAEYVNGYMVFTTAHFSDYAIVYEGTVLGDEADAVVPQAPAEDASFPILPVIIAAIAGLVIIIILKKKKGSEE